MATLDEVEVVYLWVDGIYVIAGLEQDKAALLVALAAIVRMLNDEFLISAHQTNNSTCNITSRSVLFIDHNLHIGDSGQRWILFKPPF